MKNIVILAGSGIGSVLTIARSIKKDFVVNCYVICFNINYANIFKTSKYINESIDIIGTTDYELVEKLKSWITQKSFTEKPILFFTNDTSCIFVDKHREWLLNYFTFIFSSSKIIQTFNFKGKGEIEAELNGLKIPKTSLVSTIEDLNQVLCTFKFPVIIKPTSSLEKKSLGFKVKIIHDSESFKNIINKLIQDKKAFVCQEYIPGNDNKVHYYLFYRDIHGNIYDTMGIKLLQNPPNGGIMAKGISKYNSEIAQMSRKFLENINYVGIGGIEYKEFNGEYYFIEMSTRTEGFFLICEKAGVPISIIVYKTLSCLPIKNQYPQKNGIKYIDLLSTLSARKHSKNFLRLLVDYLDAFLNPKTYINIFKWNDMYPFFIQIKMLIKRK